MFNRCSLSISQRRPVLQGTASHLPHRIQYTLPRSHMYSSRFHRLFPLHRSDLHTNIALQPPGQHHRQQQPGRQRTTRHGTNIGEPGTGQPASVRMKSCPRAASENRLQLRNQPEVLVPGHALLHRVRQHEQEMPPHDRVAHALCLRFSVSTSGISTSKETVMSFEKQQRGGVEPPVLPFPI